MSSSHVRLATGVEYRYEVKYHVDDEHGLTWRARVSRPGRTWDLAGGGVDMQGTRGQLTPEQAVREDIGRSIDTLE
jgi:hypothetical protein